MQSLLTSHKYNKRYRSDIDGLRAIAVLLVLVFHLDIGFFNGGFVGVDIFFVISGYLITKNINNSLDNGKFSIKEFYIGRFRRLFPALFVVVTAVFILSGLYFSPVNFARVGESSIYSILSVSNIFFWLESGYFDTDSSLKPLLHTWSLSVEEQFYLFWPALLLLLYKHNFSRTFFLIFTVLIFYFISELFARQEPSGAYLLSPFRIGELALGALLTCVRHKPNQFQSIVMTTVGLSLIFFSAINFTKNTVFPGFAAAVPTIGAAFLILSKKNIISVLYDNYLGVKIGLISYSLYLVHWPIIVFYKYVFDIEVDYLNALYIVILCFFFAVMLNVMVESKFRYKDGLFSRKYVRTISTLSVLLLLSLSIHSIHSNGWSWRFDNSNVAQLVGKLDSAQENRFKLIRSTCRDVNYPIKCASISTSKNNVVVVGNSHALDVYNALSSAFPNINVIQLGLGGCHSFYNPLHIEDTSYMKSSRCIKHNNEALEYISDNSSQISAVFISNYSGKDGADKITYTANLISEKTKLPVVFLGDSLVFWPKPLTEIVVNDKDVIDRMYRVKLSEDYDELFRENLNEGIMFISKKDAFCKEELCKVIYDDHLLTYDHHHLSVPATKVLGRHIRKELSNSIFLNTKDKSVLTSN